MTARLRHTLETEDLFKPWENGRYAQLGVQASVKISCSNRGRCGHTDKVVTSWTVFSLLSPHSAFSVLSHQHKSSQWHRMPPNAHPKTQPCVHSVPVCTWTDTWWPTSGRLLCIFPHDLAAAFLTPWSPFLYVFVPIMRPVCFDYCSVTIQSDWICLSIINTIIRRATCVYISSEQTWVTCFLHWNTFVLVSVITLRMFSLTLLLCFFCSLAFGTLYPAYSSYKAVKTKNVKEYVSIAS